MLAAMAPSAHHIVVFGQTGVGKSWCCNKLLQPGQQQFEESDRPEACTQQISSKIAFNGDNVVDVPGYFDTHNNDRTNQAAFFDFLKNKSLRAVLFVYNNRIDSFMQSALDALKASGIGNKVVLVFNKRLRQPNAEKETNVSHVQINVMANQPNLNVLKTHIESMQPTVASYLVAPFSLFRQPLEICQASVVEEFLERRQLNVTIPVSREVVHYVTERRRKGWGGPHFGIATGLARWVDETVPVVHTVTEETVAERTHEVYQKYKYSYATRFDGVVDLYSREILPGQERVVRLDYHHDAEEPALSPWMSPFYDIFSAPFLQ